MGYAIFFAQTHTASHDLHAIYNERMGSDDALHDFSGATNLGVLPKIGQYILEVNGS